MAFENVFRGIDFGAPYRARQNEENLLMQAIGQGMAAYERGEDRKLRERQLDIKENQKDAFDLKQTAIEGYMAISRGQEPTPIQSQAMDVSAAMMRPTSYVNQMGVPVVQQPVDPRAALNSPMGSQAIPDMPVSVPPVSMAQLEQQQPQSLGMPPPPLPSDIPRVSGPLAGTPKGQIMEAQVGMDVQKEIEREERAQKNLQKFNQSQLQAASFANRMKESEDIMDSLGKGSEEGRTGFIGGLSKVLTALPLGEAGTGLGDAIVKAGATEDQQRYLNAASNWVSANLRKESGAVIGVEEMAQEYAKYFPMPLDKPQVIKDKERLRKAAEKGMIGQSAGSYQLQFGKKAKALKDSTPDYKSKYGLE